MSALRYVFFCPSGWVCQSEEKRFREVNHRSHAAEGVPAQSSEWRPDWNAAQSSSSSDKYASIKPNLEAENKVDGVHISCLTFSNKSWGKKDKNGTARF